MKTRKPKDAGELAPVKVYNNRELCISYQTFWEESGTPGAPIAPCGNTMSKKKRDASEEISPISNAPSLDASYDDSVPSKRDMVRYRLQRQITRLRASEKNLLGKLSRCLEVIADAERFLDNGLKLDQWETYDELMRRKAKLRATREMIVDVDAEQRISDEQAKALKERMRL